jgi:hypothetical protein
MLLSMSSAAYHQQGYPSNFESSPTTIAGWLCHHVAITYTSEVE